MKTPEQIAEALYPLDGTLPALVLTLREAAAKGIEADRAQLHGLTVADVEFEHEADESGAWVNIILWRHDEFDMDDERIALGSILLSTGESPDIRRELRDAERDTERAYRDLSRKG